MSHDNCDTKCMTSSDINDLCPVCRRMADNLINLISYELDVPDYNDEYDHNQDESSLLNDDYCDAVERGYESDERVEREMYELQDEFQ